MTRAPSASTSAPWTGLVLAVLLATVTGCAATPTPFTAGVTSSKTLGSLTLAEEQRISTSVREFFSSQVDLDAGHRFHCALQGHQAALEQRLARGAGSAEEPADAYRSTCSAETETCVEKTEPYADGNRSEAVATLARTLSRLAPRDCEATVADLEACVRELEPRLKSMIELVNSCRPPPADLVHPRHVAWRPAGAHCRKLRQLCPGYLRGTHSRTR